MKKDKPKLELDTKEYIEQGHIVNVHFIKSPSIFHAEVLYRPATTGDSWHLKTRDGIVYVQMFERMDLVDSVP